MTFDRILGPALLATLAVIPACHDHGTSTGRRPDEYTGCATDELWPKFDDETDVASASDAPVLTAPAPGPLGGLRADFTWTPSAALVGTPGGDVPSTCEDYKTGFTTLHLAPISGTVYDLQLSVGGAVRHRVLTTLQKWTPSPATWSALAGETVELRLRRMVVLNNDRTEGPFATAATFVIAPQAEGDP